MSATPPDRGTDRDRNGISPLGRLGRTVGLTTTVAAVVIAVVLVVILIL
jgi:hypothetical protein